jgi:carbon monoxide dehydrogenase subunit G
MQLTSQQTLPVAQDVAWRALNDIELLRESIPGCESITPTGENEYEALVVAAVGPVKAKFKGRLRLTDLDPPNAYTIQFDGQGGAAGHGKGSAQVRLQPAGANTTQLHYVVNASVGGKIAQVGSRLVDMAAQKIANDFFANFTAKLRERHAPAAAAPPPSARQGIVARLLAWLRRLFGGSRDHS